MKAILVSLLCLLNLVIKAQTVKHPLPASYVGLGAYSRNFTDIFSATINQASLAKLKAGGFGVYSERRFMLQDLSQFTAIVAMPTKSGTIGFQGDYFGAATFNESQLGFLYARTITANIDVGAKFNFHSVRIAGYGSANAINFEAGSIIHLTDKLHAGIHVYNPTSSKIGKSEGEKLAFIYRTGFGYEASKDVFISTEIVKQEDQPVSINAGLQYNVLDKVSLRGGISTTVNSSFFGAGLQLGFARVDAIAAYHPELGFTPGILLLIKFSKKPVE